jgi:hypothetical protein
MSLLLLLRGAGGQTATVALSQTSTLAITPLVIHPYAVALTQTNTMTVVADTIAPPPDPYSYVAGMQGNGPFF